MENRYFVQERPGLASALAIIGGAVVFLLFFGLGIGGFIGWLIGTGIAGLCLYIAYEHARAVYEIRLQTGKTGTITFRRDLGSVTVAVRDITVLRGIRTTDYGSVEWAMGVWDSYGHVIHVGYFHGAREFITELTQLNPRIEVTGVWPSIGFPE